MIISHRGYAKEHKENTILAFEAAFVAGTDGIETDVRVAGDGNIVVSHDPVESSQGLLSLDELFAYIAEKKDAPFFLEMKDSSPTLLDAVVTHISSLNAWERVHLIGFAHNIKTTLTAQKKYPRILVDQIIKFPLFSYIKPPQKSNAVYIGWLDDITGSERLFRSLISSAALSKLKAHFEKLGFKVYGGVLNREDGIRLFQSAGISDIFTDETVIAVQCLTQQPQL